MIETSKASDGLRFASQWTLKSPGTRFRLTVQPDIVRHAWDVFAEDREVVRVAVMQDGDALSLANQVLWTDPELVVAAATSWATAMRRASIIENGNL